jgi:hypothetical protein
LPANIPTQSPYCKPDSRRDLAIVLLRWNSSRYVLRSFCHGKTSAVRSPKISAWISESAPRVTVQRGLSVGPDIYDKVCDISLFLARLVFLSPMARILAGQRSQSMIEGVTGLIFLGIGADIPTTDSSTLLIMPRSIWRAGDREVVRSVSMPGPHPRSVMPAAYHLPR